MKTAFVRADGFTLVEVLLVLGLIVLMASMLPRGLSQMYEGSQHRALVQQTLGSARACFLLSQQQQRAVRLGSLACTLPARLDKPELLTSMPVFFADGTASHSAHIVVESVIGGQLQRSVVVVDKLTASARVQENAETQ